MLPGEADAPVDLDALGGRSPVGVRDQRLGQGRDLRHLGALLGHRRGRVDRGGPGQLDLDEMISKRVALDGINDAFEQLQQGTIARSVIVFDE